MWKGGCVVILWAGNIRLVALGFLICSRLRRCPFSPRPFQKLPSRVNTGISRGSRAATVTGIVFKPALDLLPFLLPCFSPPIPHFQQLGIANHFVLRKSSFCQYDIVSFEHGHKTEGLWACTLKDGIKEINFFGAEILQLLLGSDRKVAWGLV